MITGKQSLGLVKWAGPQLVMDGSGVARQSRFTSHDRLFEVDMATDGNGRWGSLFCRQGLWGISDEMRKCKHTHARRACYGMMQRMYTLTRLFVGNVACRQTFETKQQSNIICSIWTSTIKKKRREGGVMSHYRAWKSIVPFNVCFSCLKVDRFKIRFCVLFFFFFRFSRLTPRLQGVIL